MTEGTIAAWLKAEGDHVEQGESLVEVETDKVTLVLESPVQGRIHKIFAKTGSVVKVGAPLCIISQTGESLLTEQEATATSTQVETDATVIESAKTEVNSLDKQKEERRKFLLSPSARRLAKEKGLDHNELEKIFGDRKKRITSEDLAEWLEQKPKTTPLAAKMVEELGIGAESLPKNKDQRITARQIEHLLAKEVVSKQIDRTVQFSTQSKTEASRQKLTVIRKMIGERMLRSKSTAPHVTLNREVDVEDLIQVIERMNRDWGIKGIKFSLTHFCVLASARALELNLNANSSIDGEELVTWKEINIGLAVATDRGLMVPVIKRANLLTVIEISKASAELTQKARHGKLILDQLEGGTFTVSNLGMYGVDSFTPVINQPEAAILGISKSLQKPVVFDGQMAIRKMMCLSLSFDHRIIDGAEAAKLLADIAMVLEKPYSLLQ
jgi:pyruvate dehydrogenase E2 component (dihydrolipoamide acetyltransferase)